MDKEKVINYLAQLKLEDLNQVVETSKDLQKDNEKITMTRKELTSYINTQVKTKQDEAAAKKAQFNKLLGKDSEPPKEVTSAEISNFLHGN